MAAPDTLRLLVAPDSFKGSLTSVQVAEAVGAGWRRARPGDEVHLAPLADGGEGTLDAIEASGGWTRRSASTTDPIGRTIIGTWLERRGPAGAEAVVELATASGLSRLRPDERDPFGATTRGTGELLLASIEAGATSITLGIGGSATNDGGRGIVEAFGGHVVAHPADDPDWEGSVVDLAGLDSRLAGVDLRVACDVDNPLLGPRGAAATYGPQKGAQPKAVTLLDVRLSRWAAALETAASRAERWTPGAGAAGGVGFALLCLQDRFRSFALEPGVDLVMRAARFDTLLADADLVITGEGRIDAQTAYGKTALGVARRAAAAGIPCIAIGGGVTVEGIAALAGLATVVPVIETAMSVEAAMAAGAGPIERCGERLARLVSLRDG